jgi:hypothetical protein
LVICFGTGNTLGAARLHPLQRLDGVELAREVVKASSFFKETNHRVAEDPTVNIVIEDGRNYLLGTQERYDVITEEPPLIHTAGVVNLYSKDFYQLCARRLTDNGIMAVWLATWELEDHEVRMLVRAFVDAFPNVSAWDSKHLGEWILIGSKQPLNVNVQQLASRISEPKLAADLAKIGIQSPADLLALYLKGADFLKRYTENTPPVTDDHTVVDYTTPRQARANFGLGDFLNSGFSVSGVGPSGLFSELRLREFDGLYTRRDPADPLVTGIDGPQRETLLQDLRQRRLQAETEAGRKIAWNVMACASDYLQLGKPERSLQILDWGLAMVGRLPSVDLLVMKASLYQKSGRLADARMALGEALTIDPQNARAMKLAADIKS